MTWHRTLSRHRTLSKDAKRERNSQGDDGDDDADDDDDVVVMIWMERHVGAELKKKGPLGAADPVGAGLVWDARHQR